MGVLDRMMSHRGSAPPAPGPDLVRARREALVETAIALEGQREVDAVLRITVVAAARIADAAVAFVLVGPDGALERFAGEGLDRCTCETLVRPDVLGPLAERVRAAGGPVVASDLDPRTARRLAAVAPHGFAALPLGGARSGFIALVDPGSDGAGGLVEDDVVAVVTMLGRLAGTVLDRIRREAALDTTCEELRRLTRQLLARRDEELGRTAHELHEEICQRLAAANAQLEALGAVVDGQRDALARLRDARALVNQSLRELRELAQRLRPAVLEHSGYVEALRWYLKRLRDRSGAKLSLEVEGAEVRLPSEMESALYRVTEEALGAAAERGMPRRLRIRYGKNPAAVRVEIAGTPPGAVDLVAIRERLRPFGGAVRVTSPPEDAPVIEVQVPAPTSHRVH
jgi:signal transduction histidine kinase